MWNDETVLEQYESSKIQCYIKIQCYSLHDSVNQLIIA